MYLVPVVGRQSLVCTFSIGKRIQEYTSSRVWRNCFSVFVTVGNTTNSAWWHCVTVERFLIRSFHSIHNIVDRGVLQAMWEELSGKVVQRDKLIICQPRLSENAGLATVQLPACSKLLTVTCVVQYRTVA